ncbi:MAG: lysophospholipase and related esterase [Segetibacter sp.]|jgi:lysophospholipase L1-like esterase|nr:lysophospholipase and related esterase [Segetibacter sp.]
MQKRLHKTATAISLFLAIFACFACEKENMINRSPANTTPHDSTGLTRLKYLALGDSYTIGQSVQESERFSAQTARQLASHNITVQTPVYIATTGWTTANLIDAINTQNPSKNFDIVTLLVGVNDQYQHMDTAGYRTRFTTLLNASIAFAANRPSRVFVLSIPDYSATPYVPELDKARVSQQIDQFNAINKQIALASNVAYIDITPASRQATTDPALVANDGLHPSGKQYAKWSELLAPVIKNALK